MAAFATLAVAFVIFSFVVASGALNGYDRQVADAFSRTWVQSAGFVPRGFALLGGLEVTGLLMLGLGLFLFRAGMRSEAWVVAVYPVAIALEYLYKRLVSHPEPPSSLAHGDGPSLTDLFERTGGIHNSFPSGHATRTILVYGLLAFVVARLTNRPWLRRLAIPLATVVVVLMALDRMYLGVHWESDVLGGLLLGGTCLAGAIIWLDAPRREA